MKNILNKLLSIILVIIIIGHVTYTSISESITEKSIRENIKNNLLTGLIYDDKGNKTEIFNTIVRLTTLDEETVIKLMENQTADNIITDIVNSIYDYNLTGDESVKYTREKIISTVENNIDQVLNEIDYNITIKEREEVIDYTKNNTDYILDTIYKTDIGDYKKWLITVISLILVTIILE